MTGVEKLFSLGRTVFFDGAMGTMLQKAGVPKGQRPDVMNIVAPDAVESVNRAYVDAGSDIICTNTFGASAHALSGTGYTPEQIIETGIAAAKRASAGRALIAYDIGPLGEFMEPYGSMTFDAAYEMFAEQARLAEKYGADLVAIETMSELSEVRAAITAIRENTTLPVFATMTFNENARTLTGATPKQLCELAEELGVAAVGLNCSLAPSTMMDTVRELAGSTMLPLIIKPNAGLPDKDGNYDVSPEVFAEQMLPCRELGVRVVGACCGSSPEFIKALRNVF